MNALHDNIAERMKPRRRPPVSGVFPYRRRACSRMVFERACLMFHLSSLRDILVYFSRLGALKSMLSVTVEANSTRQAALACSERTE